MNNQPFSKSWKEFLKGNPDRKNYDEQAASIQSLIDGKETAVNNLRHLSDNKPLVCMTKSLINKKIQLTFFHTLKKTAILSNASSAFGLTSFGNRAYAVRLEPSDFFKSSTRNYRAPSFEELVTCTSLENVRNLVPTETMVEEKMEFHAILPPNLSEPLFDLEELSAESVLTILNNKIHTLKSEKEDESSYVSINNMQIGDQDLLFDDKDRTYEKSYGKILKFLWGICHLDTAIKSSTVISCTAPSTIAWLDKVHVENIFRKIQTHKR